MSRWPNGGDGGIDDRPPQLDATRRARYLRSPAVLCLRVEYEIFAVDLHIARAAAGSLEDELTYRVAMLLNSSAILLQACAVHFYGSHTTNASA